MEVLFTASLPFFPSKGKREREREREGKGVTLFPLP